MKKHTRLSGLSIYLPLLLVALALLNSCSLKHHIVSSSSNIDTSKSAVHSISSSFLIDSSKLSKNTIKTVVIDSSKLQSVDDYERTMTQYFSNDPLTNKPKLDSTKTTQKGKKTTQKNTQKNTTATQKESKQDINVYEAKENKVDSGSQKGIAQAATKNAGTDVGTTFGTYLLVFLAIAAMCTGAWLVKKYIIK